MNAKISLLLALLVLSIIFISGCAQNGTGVQDGTGVQNGTNGQGGTNPVCGNEIVEAGEECDGTGCTGDKLCLEDCKCESLAPPALPE